MAAIAAIAALRNLKEMTRVQSGNAYIYLIGKIALAKNVRRQTEFPPSNNLERIMRVHEIARRIDPIQLMQHLREGLTEMTAHLNDAHMKEFMDTFGPFPGAESATKSLSNLRQITEYFEDGFSRNKIPADRLTDRIIGVEITANVAWGDYTRLLEEVTAAANALVKRFDLRSPH
ncbi:hypothetical protein J2W92_005075 [Rhizobium leguminosarum]|uniref:hypothetical protein n=1 Tax=Rhizobium leguminosarum TaxID=384 RepID=UPI0024B33308|nr:hypothetical protein [Rhizobium leguminosarum]WHO79823.1 hypothetical protein QMO81_002525 [Rhizobium leguminosarum]